MAKLVNGILRRLQQLANVARMASEVWQVQEQGRRSVVVINDAHRLVCEHVRRVAAIQVQSRPHVTVEIHPAQLGTTRPVLELPRLLAIYITEQTCINSMWLHYSGSYSLSIRGGRPDLTQSRLFLVCDGLSGVDAGFPANSLP